MKRYIFVILLLAATIAANYAFSRPEKPLERSSLEHFPKNIGEWEYLGSQTIGESSMKVLMVDDYIMQRYVNKNKDTIGLYIGYFLHQREGKQVHSPRQCLPGSGWNIEKHEEYKITIPGPNFKDVAVNLLVMKNSNEKRLFLWWYQGRGRIYAGEYWNKIYLIWDAITRNRTDGAMVRIDIGITSSVEDSLDELNDFALKLFCNLSDYIPE